MNCWQHLTLVQRNSLRRGDPTTLRAYVEAIAAQWHVEIEYVAEDFRAEMGRGRRRAFIPPPIDIQHALVALHEIAHCVRGPCDGRHDHHVERSLRADACVRCEAGAWELAQEWLPCVPRSVHERVRRALGSYTRNVWAPPATRKRAAALMDPAGRRLALMKRELADARLERLRASTARLEDLTKKGRRR